MLSECKDSDKLEIAGGLSIYRIVPLEDGEQFLEFSQYLAANDPFQKVVNKGVTVAAVFLADD